MQSSVLLKSTGCTVLALIAMMQASCFNDAEIYTVATEVTPEGKVIQKPRVVSVSRHRRELSQAGPRARLDHSVHDFGRLDPSTTHQHTFVIWNDGTEPLELTEGPTTCKCTVANLVNGTVAPGEKVVVAMQWNTGRDLEYSHSATIYTNDPQHRVLTLQIKGQVEALLRCQPEELVFSRVEPGETPSASTVVYSQMWNDFDISEVVSPQAGVVHTIEPATDAERKELQAASAYRVTLTLPDDLTEGYFTIPVQLKATAKDGDQAPTDSPRPTDADCEVTLEGKILRRLSLYGPHVDTQGTILMGRIPQGRGATVKLLVKVRDAQRDLRVTKIETLPPSLAVHLEPYHVHEDKDVGLYHLTLTLPKDAPTFRLPPNRLGRVYLEFDHPRIPSLELPLDLIVTPRTDLAQ